MPDLKEIIAAVIEEAAEDEETFLKTLGDKELSEKGKEATLAAYRLLKGFSDELSEEALKAISKATGHVEVKEKEVPAKADPEKKKVEKSLNETIEKQATQLDAVTKSLEAVTKTMEDMKEKTELQVHIDKAEKELSHVPGHTSQELGEILHTLEKAKKGSSKTTFEAFKKANDLVKGSALLRAAGSQTPEVTEGSAQDQVNKKAAALITKSADPMTHDEAVLKVLEDNPELYDKYAEENEKQFK